MLNPPTDNLYKFIAVLGLITISGSGALWVQTEMTIDSATHEFLTETEGFRVVVPKYFAEANKAMKFARENGYGEGTPKDKKKKLDELLDAADPLQARANELAHRMEGPLWLYQKRLERYEYLRAIAMAGIFFGVVTFGMGMYLWQKRLQSKLDKKLSR